MKQDDKQVLQDKLNKTIIKTVEVKDEMSRSFISYAMAVNVSRAIPDVRDGLKPVHRRILYSMGELNNFNDKPYKKCARIVGEVMGKYHPHGDSSVYDALVRLAQDFSINEPLIEGHGNFGSVDGDPPAAQRYTEARLSRIASEMLRDIDKDTVDKYPNFDDTLMQPRVLPSKFPNLLVNGADGIAVGMATNIPPHNLVEVINATQALIANPEIEIEDLIDIVPAPDYPTGGIIMGRAALKNSYRTGRGGVVVRGRAEIEEHNGRQRIIITELPYQVNKARFIVQMADYVKSKRIEGISDIREESDREGMRVIVEIKKDANAQVVLNLLYKYTQLQVSGGITMLALVHGEPKVLNLKEVLYYYLEHQKDVITRRTKFDLNKAEEREHIVKGLVIAQANIDEVIAIIKQSDDKQDAQSALMEKFLLTEIQANAILEMKLARLTGLEVGKLKEELTSLKITIADLKDILASPARVLQIINDELEEIKNKYGSPRKTEISIDYGDIDIADLIEKEDVVVSVSHFGYIKRMSTSEYRAQKRGGVGVSAHKTKEEDFVENIFSTSTHDDLLFFTNKGKVYTIKAYEIPEASRQSKGRAMVNLIQVDQDEKVTTIIPLKNAEEKKYLLMVTKDGLIKKTKLTEFDSIRKVGKIAITLVDGDELISVKLSTGEDEILLASHFGKCIRFSEKDVRATGRNSMGVKSMSIAKNDFIVDATIIDQDSQVITITQNGYGKRSKVSDYRLQSRGGKGIKAGNITEKTGKVVCLKQVNEDQDLMIISDNGVIIRTPVSDISSFARSAMGVKIMRLRDEAKIVSVAKVEKEEESIEEIITSQIEEKENN
ncbi:MAG: DNA gyrase subunit A [Christensenellales bacterium]|jgi:DNA gyrase subunit A